MEGANTTLFIIAHAVLLIAVIAYFIAAVKAGKTLLAGRAQQRREQFRR